MKKHFDTSILLIFLCFFVFSDLNAQTTNIYPDANWAHHDSPESAGFSSSKIEKIKKHIIQEMNTTGLVVIVGGKALLLYGDIKSTSYVASCRKSFLSMLYGKYVQNGTINLSTTLKQLDIDDHKGLLELEKQATIKDLLTARSGVYHPSSNGGDASKFAPERGSKIPGSYFLYNNWDFNLAGFVFQKLTGMDIYESLEKDLAKPIEMQDFNRQEQTLRGDLSKSRYPAYHMWLSTRDMARIGYLMLREGIWKDVQIIPRTWIKKTTSIVSSSKETSNEYVRKEAYGYLWWIYETSTCDSPLEGAYFTQGSFGQYLTVIPKLDMVIAHKTNNIYRRKTSPNMYRDLVFRLIDAKN